MIWIGLWMLLTGGAQPLEVTTDRVSTHVTDPVRLEQALEVLEEAEDVLTEHDGTLADTADRLRALALIRTTPNSEFEAVLDRTDVLRREAQDRLIELRFALKRSLTREEWAAVFARPHATPEYR